MDANVLRAALAAAIRVTVSSALVGCGGSTIADPQSTGQPSTSEPPEYYPPTPSSGGTATSYPPSASPQSSAGTYPSATAGASTTTGDGGAFGAEGGATAAEGGGPATPQVPQSFCETPAMLACAPIFDALVAEPPLWTDPLEPEALACCQSLVTALDAANTELEIECRQELDQRLNEVRFPCCPALDFQGQACTPWGPPVPPELDLEQLLAWSAAA